MHAIEGAGIENAPTDMPRHTSTRTKKPPCVRDQSADTRSAPIFTEAPVMGQVFTLSCAQLDVPNAVQGRRLRWMTKGTPYGPAHVPRLVQDVILITVHSPIYLADGSQGTWF